MRAVPIPISSTVKRHFALLWVPLVALVLAACVEPDLSTPFPPLLGATAAPETGEAAEPEAETVPEAEVAAVAPEAEEAPVAAGIYPDVEPVGPDNADAFYEQSLVTVAPPPPQLSAPEPAQPTPVMVALLVPLSGRGASVGRALLNAAQMALFDVAPDRMALHPKDTQGTPEGAALAMESALQDGAQLVLGPLFSGSVTGAASVARERGVNVIAFSNDRTVAGDGVFLMGLMPEAQVERVVRFAATQGLTRFAGLIPETSFGLTVENALQRAVRDDGGMIARVERYPPDAEDFFAPVQRLADYDRRRGELQGMRADLESRGDEISRRTLKRLEGLETVGEVGYDAVVIADGGTRLRAIAPLLPFYDIDPNKVRFLGTILWSEPGIGREPALVGGWFAGPDPAVGESFRTRFEALHGTPPLRIASLAYDAVALAAALVRGREEPDYSATMLTNTGGFSGVDGIFRFGADGIAERGLAILEIQERGFGVVSRARRSFTELVN